MRFRGKPTNTPQGALARLWRAIITENNLLNSMDYLTNRYLQMQCGGNAENKRKAKSVLEADLQAKEMTWKKFTHLLFSYLAVLKVEVTIKLTYSNGKQSTHAVGLISSENIEESKRNKDLREEANGK